MQNISLSYLFNLALKRLWILILATVVFAVSAFAYSKLVLVPVYSSTASILVTNGGIIFQGSTIDTEDEKTGTRESISGSDISSSVAVANNVIELLKSPNKYIKFAEEFDDKYTYGSLMGKASIKLRNSDTIFIDISFSSTDGSEAMRLANAYAEFACKEIPNDIKNAEVSLVSTALSYSKLSPNIINNTAIAAVVGLLLAYLAVFIIDISDQSLRGEDEFVERYDIPLIGSVPDFESIAESSNGRYSYGKGGYFGGKY